MANDNRTGSQRKNRNSTFEKRVQTKSLYSKIIHSKPTLMIKVGDAQTKLYPIESTTKKARILTRINTLYLMFTTDVLTTNRTMVAGNFCWKYWILIQILQFRRIQNWLKRRRIRENDTKSTQVIFTLIRKTCYTK